MKSKRVRIEMEVTPKDAQWDFDKSCTVGVLIDALSNLDKNLRVITEGCDCYGNAVALEVSDKQVLICRSN